MGQRHACSSLALQFTCDIIYKVVDFMEPASVRLSR